MLILWLLSAGLSSSAPLFALKQGCPALEAQKASLLVLILTNNSRLPFFFFFWIKLVSDKPQTCLSLNQLVLLLLGCAVAWWGMGMCCVWSFNCCYKKKLSGWIKQGLSRFSWKHLKTHFPCHCISFFFFFYVFNPECHTSVLLVIGFFPVVPFSLSPINNGNWRRKKLGRKMHREKPTTFVVVKLDWSDIYKQNMVFLQQLQCVSMHFPAFQFSCWAIPPVSRAANINVIFLPFFCLFPSVLKLLQGQLGSG